MAKAKEWDVSWDCPHQPNDDPAWQESDCYWFYDPSCGVGGFQRIGQKPNQGTAQVTCFVFAKDSQRYVLNDHHQRKRALGRRWDVGQEVDGHSAESLGDGRMRYRWNDAESSADIEFYGAFYTPRDWLKNSDKAAPILEQMNSDGHLEVGGRIKGTVRIGDRNYEIDGLAHRDRSWGIRRMGAANVDSYRLFSGTCGPKLSFATFYLELADGTPIQGGYIIREGIEQDIVDLRIVASIDMDGFSVYDSTAIISLESGEEVRIHAKTVQSFLTPSPAIGMVMSDNISTFQYEGETGFLDLELVNNPLHGKTMPTQNILRDTVIEMGLSASREYFY